MTYISLKKFDLQHKSPNWFITTTCKENQSIKLCTCNLASLHRCNFSSSSIMQNGLLSFTYLFILDQGNMTNFIPELLQLLLLGHKPYIKAHQPHPLWQLICHEEKIAYNFVHCLLVFHLSCHMLNEISLLSFYCKITVILLLLLFCILYLQVSDFDQVQRHC